MARQKQFRAITAYDRPNVAFANLLDLDPEAAAFALLAPDRLTPAERDPLADRVMKDPEKHPFLRTLMNITTNPIFLLGLLAAVKFPPIRASELLKIAPKFTAMGNALPRPIRFISSTWRTFAGTQVPQAINNIFVATDDFLKKYLFKLGDAFSDYRQTAGKAMDIDKAVRVAAYSERLDQTSDWLTNFWKVKKPILKRVGGMTPEMRKLGDSVRTGVSDDIFAAFTKDPKVRARIAAEAEKLGLEGFAFRKNYFPHMVAATPEEFARIAHAAAKVTDPRQQQMMNGILTNLEGILASNIRPRPGRLIPDLAALERVFGPTGELNRDVIDLLRRKMGALADYGRFELSDALTLAGKDALKGRKKIIRILVGQKGAGEISKGIPLLEGMARRPGFGYTMEDAKRFAANATTLLKGKGYKAAEIGLHGLISDTANALPYSLNYPVVMKNYVNRMAKMWAFSGTGFGAQLEAEQTALALAAGKGSRGAGQRVGMLNEYIRMLKGIPPTERQIDRLWWHDFSLRAYNYLDAAESKKWIPEPMRQWMVTKLEDAFAGGPGIGRTITGHLYLSTLGINLSPALKNTLQNVLTTQGLFGPEAYLRAHRRTVPKLVRYLGSRVDGLDDVAAMKKSFPQYMASGVHLDPIQEEYLGEIMGRKGWATKAKHYLMTAFTASERYNRVLAFDMAKIAADDAGMALAEGNALAAQIVHMTQFPAGPADMIYGLRNLPSWARMFMHFPLRFVEFLRMSTIMGSGSPLSPRPGARQWGTVGRVAMASTAIYESVKEIAGIDLSQGLLFGALPLPQFEGSPFYPFPFVPPAIGIMGAAAQSLLTGEMRPVERVAPLMLPGGIGLARAYRTFSPKHADYQNRRPDGTIPVMDHRGLTISFRTPRQLMLRGLGFTPSSVAEEAQVVKYLSKQREQITDYRRRYMQALLVGDVDEASRLNQEYEQRYPNMGGIQVRKSDIAELQERKMLTRAERVLRQLPKHMQPMFTQIAGAAFAPSLGQALEGPVGSRLRPPAVAPQWGALPAPFSTSFRMTESPTFEATRASP